MDAKRLLIGSVVGAVVISVTGFLVWGTLLFDFFDSQMIIEAREPPVVWAVVASSLIHGLLITLVLGWTDSRSAAKGFKTALVLGLLLWLGTDLILFATLEFGSLAGVLTDACLGAIQYGITGALIAVVAGGVASAPAVPAEG